tara:strand:+ start:143 stop:331 length:189 start_codon:yes stop_codon:yes gene_type:complete
MSYRKRFTQLSTEAVEKAAQSVLNQLSARLNFSKNQLRNDKELECMQFGICSYEAQPQRVVL